MSRGAWAYIWSVLIAAATASVSTLLFGPIPIPVSQWPTFVALTVLATLAQLFKAEAPTHQTYFATPVFLFAGVLLLHPFFFALLVIASYSIEWIKERVVRSPQLRKWYLQPFNISTHILAGLSAHWIFIFIRDNNSLSPDWLPSLPMILSVFMAAALYVTVNHFLIGLALVLARKISWRESGVMETENLVTELILLLIGYTVTVLWEIDPWMVVPALAPLLLIYRALTIPQLKKEAQTDAKTGLWNARHFSTLFTAEMERAKRFNRPLALIMADLDLLRNINNTYGHLAGDVVLTGIGRIIRETIREYDIAGRFGGEEFSIVMPEVGPEEAKALGERLREAVEQGSFDISTSSTPIHVTMSIGISCFPIDADTPKDLLHEADVAVYQAKLNGRNCVVCTTDLPHSIELSNMIGVVDRLASPYSGTFMPRVSPGGSEGDANAEHGNLPPHPNSPFPIPDSQPASIASGVRTGANGHSASSAATLIMDPPIVDTVGKEHNPEQAQSPEEGRAASYPYRGADTGTRPYDAPMPATPVVSHQSSVASPQPPTPSPKSPNPPKSQKPNSLALKAFVSAVIVLNASMTVASVAVQPNIDFLALLLICGLAMLGEYLQVDLYGPGTVSVSVAVTFAAALILGIPGAAVASLAIALVHYYRRRPAIYQTAFNWATHVCASVPTALVIGIFGLRLDVENLILLAIPVGLSALAYYVLDTGLVATVICLASGEGSPISVWGDRYKWLANHYLVLCFMGLFLGVAYTMIGPFGMIVFTMPIVMMHYTQRQYVDRTEDSVRELQRMNGELTRANQEVISANQSIYQLNEELFQTLSKIIDARDPWVSSHAAQVADYAVAIGVELGMSIERLPALRQAGFLHDIGKIGISEQVLHKPGKLTDEEYEYVKTHAALGGEFLDMVTSLRHLTPFVRHHHERWDGKGYPDAISGEDIELESRILSVCDSAEAMASDRPYRKGMSIQEIIDEVSRCAGTQFDPTVAAAFIKVAERERETLLINSGQEMMRKHSDNSYLLLANSVTGPLSKLDSGPLPQVVGSG